MKFIAVKSVHIAMAAALATGLFSVSAANAVMASCKSAPGIQPSCTTSPIPARAGTVVHFSASAGAWGDDQARGIVKILRGTTVIYGKPINGPFPFSGHATAPTTASYKARVSSTRAPSRPHAVSAAISNEPIVTPK